MNFRITDTSKNNYYEWLYLAPNYLGMSHILHDIERDQWFLVHASGYRFDAKMKDGKIESVLRFLI